MNALNWIFIVLGIVLTIIVIRTINKIKSGESKNAGDAFLKACCIVENGW